MAEVNPMMAVNDTITVALPKDDNGTLTGVIELLGTAAGANVVLEVSANDQTTWNTPVKITDPVPKSDVTALTTHGQTGWCEAVGYTHARLRLTALTTQGNGVRGRLNFRKN